MTNENIKAKLSLWPIKTKAHNANQQDRETRVTKSTLVLIFLLTQLSKLEVITHTNHNRLKPGFQ